MTNSPQSNESSESPEEPWAELQYQPSGQFSIAQIMIVTAMAAGLCTLFALGFYAAGCFASVIPFMAASYTMWLTERLGGIGVAISRREQFRAFCFTVLVLALYFGMMWLMFVILQRGL